MFPQHEFVLYSQFTASIFRNYIRNLAYFSIVNLHYSTAQSQLTYNVICTTFLFFLNENENKIVWHELNDHVGEHFQPFSQKSVLLFICT